MEFLQPTDQEIRNVIENIPVGLCVYQREGDTFRCLSVNSGFADMVGLGENELVGAPIKTIFALIHPEDRARCRQETASMEILGLQISGLYRIYNRRRGGYIWLRLDGQSVSRGNGDYCVFLTCTDESEAMQARTVLEQSRQAMNSIVRYAPGGVFVYSAEEDEQFSFVSENMLLMLGYTLEEFREKFDNRFSHMVYAEDREATLQTIWSQIAVGPFDTCFYRVEKKDGSLIWVHDEGHIVADEHGKRWFYVVIVDITASEATKSNLTSQNNELRRLINSIPARIVVYRKSVGGTVGVVAANGYLGKLARVGTELLSLSQDELLGLVAPEDQADTAAFFHRLFAREVCSDEFSCRVQLDRDAGYMWYHCSANAMLQEDGSVLVYTVLTDATLQKKREDDYNHVLQELLTANPNSLCAVRLNLTRNLCSDRHGISEFTRRLLDAKTADELLTRLAATIPSPRERVRFSQEYSCSSLLRKFQNGEERCAASYLRMTGNEMPHWVTTYFHILRNPSTEDVEAIVYSVDSDHTHKEAEIVGIITGEEYDCIGLIVSDTGAVSYYYASENIGLPAEKLPASYREAIGLVCGRVLSVQDRENFLRDTALETIRSRLETSPVYVCSLSCLSTAGEHHRKQIRFRYLDQERMEIFFSMADITATFEHEEAYAEQLRTALQNAEKANEMKSDFLGNVSHDMRTPLNAILGYNRLAMEVPGTPPQVLDFLQKMETAGSTLLSLINDTLDLQRIELGAFHLQPQVVSCCAVIRDVITSVQPMMEKKHLLFVVDNSRAVMSTIRTDVVRVREIFINLLSNAAKFTPEGGRVELVVECVGLDRDCVHDRLIVRDNGIGMSPDFMEKMYEPFAQERTQSNAHVGGSGLGLSIVRRTVELLGGRIEAKSELGKGTEFTVYLDFERADDASAQSAAPDGSPASIRGLHFLLCEDNEMNAEIAQRILEISGASVVTASDGWQGSNRFLASGADEFDAVLMDLRMPNMNGYDAAQRIRRSQHPQAKTIPILAMSADAYASDVERAIQAGMNGHVSKPVDPRALVGELARLTAGSGKKAPAVSPKPGEKQS